MNKFVRYCSGYVRIRLTGNSPERMLNMCGNKNTIIWDLVRAGDGYEFSIPVNTFKKLKPLLKKTKTKIVIIKRRGLPFIIESYKARQIFLVGVLMFAAMLYTLSQYIWEISVEGSQIYTEEMMLKYLEEQNVSTKMLKKNIDTDKIEENIRLNLEHISWVSAEIDGSKLIVHVKEALQTYKKDEKVKTADIVAKDDGIITFIVTRKGTPLVKKGDKVKKGDVLISGTIDLYNDSGEICDKRYVEASGDVHADVLYNYSYYLPLRYMKKEYTGNEYVKKEYFVLKNRIKFNFSKTKYDKYDKIVAVSKFEINKSFSLPIEKHIITYKEYKIYETVYSDEEAIGIAKETLNKTIEELHSQNISTSKNNVKIKIVDGICYAKGTILLHENLGKSKTFNAAKRQKALEKSLEQKTTE